MSEPSGGKRSRLSSGPRIDVGSEGARKWAATILQVLAGEWTPGEGAQSLGVSLPRFYAVEMRAMAGLVKGCEPRGGKRVRLPEKEVAELQKQVVRLERECARKQALLRASKRTVRIQPPPAPKRKVKRRRRPAVRALKMATLWCAASRLGLCGRTIATWLHDWGQDRLRVESRGRPAERTDRETRDAVIALFQLMGPGVGLPVLQEIFPAVARRELEDLQRQWHIRLLLSPRERESFQSAVESFRVEEQKTLGCLPGIVPGPRSRAQIDCRTITRALVAHGILNFRRRRILVYHLHPGGIHHGLWQL